MYTTRKSHECVRKGSSVPSNAVEVICVECLIPLSEPVYEYRRGNGGHVVVVNPCRDGWYAHFGRRCKVSEGGKGMSGSHARGCWWFKRLRIGPFCFLVVVPSPTYVNKVLSYVVGGLCRCHPACYIRTAALQTGGEAQWNVLNYLVDNVCVFIFAVTFVGLPVRVALVLDAVLIYFVRFIVRKVPWCWAKGGRWMKIVFSNPCPTICKVLSLTSITF